jgi:hypothetical protein
VHKFKCVFSRFHNLFFMKLMVLRVRSSLIEPRTWIATISTILMNYESLWLRIEDPKTLHHNLVSGLKSFSFHKTCSELYPIVILKKETYKSRVRAKSM